MAPTAPQKRDGQDHERLHRQQLAEGAETLPFTPPSISESISERTITGKGAAVAAAVEASGDPGITVLQRMLSATTGSLLTGLLGRL